MKKIVFLLLLMPFFVLAQDKLITLEDIYKTGTFRGEFVPGFAELPLDSIINPKDVLDETGKNSVSP